MTFLDSSLFLYIVFAIAASIELCFFMLQRSALELGRASGFEDRESRLMLPFWYLLVWPTKLAKWASAIYIGLEGNWLLAIALLAVTFAFQIFVPIPHQQFIPTFRRKITKEMGEAVSTGVGPDVKIYANLYKKLFEISRDSRFD